MKITFTALVTLLLLASFNWGQKSKLTPMSPAAKPSTGTLDGRIQDAIAGFQGKVFIYAKNLDTGKEYSLRGDEQTRTASTIKLAVMAETFHQVAQSTLHWDDPIELTKEKKQGGSGILFEFSDGTKIDLKNGYEPDDSSFGQHRDKFGYR